VGRGVPSLLGQGFGKGAVTSPRKIVSIFELKKASFGAFWVLFFS